LVGRECSIALRLSFNIDGEGGSVELAAIVGKYLLMNRDVG